MWNINEIKTKEKWLIPECSRIDTFPRSYKEIIEKWSLQIQCLKQIDLEKGGRDILEHLCV
jgi:hypothetical protein